MNSCKVQTIENLQFVLIDDGSTDRSGEIADRYSREDKRFQVYHTENHGVAADRDYGLTKADADWIMFIDSDDWVEPDFCKIPLKAAIEYDADLVIFNYYGVTARNNIKECPNITSKGVIVLFTAIDIGKAFRWNKTCHRSLFSGIDSKSKWEDSYITAKQAFIANRIVCIPDYLYYYQERENSLTHTSTNDRKMFIADSKRYVFLIDKGYPKDKADGSVFLVPCYI